MTRRFVFRMCAISASIARYPLRDASGQAVSTLPPEEEIGVAEGDAWIRLLDNGADGFLVCVRTKVQSDHMTFLSVVAIRKSV